MKKEVLIMVINLALAVAAGLIIVLFHLFPLFTIYLLSICVCSFIFILTERWKTHYAAEFENRFWTLMAFLLARTCLFVSDSPLSFPDDRQGVAWCIVVLFTYLAHNYDRHLRRLGLIRTPNIKRVPSSSIGEALKESAREKADAVRALMDSIDMPWMSSTFLNIFFLPRVLCAERDIIAVMTEATADELNLIVPQIALPRILYKVKDHRMAGRFNRRKLLDLLAKERVVELSVSCKAVLLDAMQKMKLTAVGNSDHYVRSIIFSTKGDDLSELKCITDGKGDFYSMHKLLYEDIRSASVKEEILAYIRTQAHVQAAHHRIGSKASKRRGKLAWRKILSDVDDTLYCSGGSWPAGMDLSFPKKALYPGVLAFYRELDLGVVGQDEWEEGRLGNLVFLSARPHVYKDVSENVTYDKFVKLQREKGLYTMPSLLAGSLDTGSQFMIRGDSEPLARKKFLNFKEYVSLYPEYTCVFIGDNGQGDVRAAELVFGDPAVCGNLQRTYVHVVQPLDKTYVRSPDFVTTKERRVCYFVTYIDAAIDAFENNLIRLSGLRKIMVEASGDFDSIADQQWTSKKAAAIKPTAADHPVSPPSPVRAATSKSTSVSSAVEAPAGNLKPAAPQGAGQSLPWRLTTLLRLQNSATVGDPLAATTAVPSKSTNVEVRRGEGLSKKFLRVDEHNRALRKGNAILDRWKIPTVSLIPYPQVLPLGSTIATDFGPGLVLSYRAEDGIYTVQVARSRMVIYMSGASIGSV